MNILIVGCSFSSGDGFSNPDGKVWSSLFDKEHVVKNVSLGGSSNQKIFNKACYELTISQYDLVIIGWTSLFRLNLNYADTIYESQINLVPEGIQPKEDKKLKSFHEYWCKHFVHGTIELTTWLTQIVTLSRILKERQTPYIFIKFVDNFLLDLQQLTWYDTSDEFKDIVLYKDDLPDWEIEEYFNKLKVLYNIVSKETENNWVNLKSEALYDIRVDVNEDLLHPGEESNKIYYNKVVTLLNRLRIMV